MTAEEFYQHLQSGVDVPNSIIVNEEISITSNNLDRIQDNVVGITFEKEVRIEDGQLNKNLRFRKCIFKEGLRFRNLTSQKGRHYVRLAFEECQIHILNFNNVDIDRDVDISLNCEIKHIHIADLKIPQHDLRMIWVQNSPSITVTESNIKSIEINGCKDVENLEISNCYGDIEVIYCVFLRQFTCKDNVGKNNLSIKDCVFNYSSSVSNCQFRQLDLLKNKFNHSFLVKDEGLSTNNKDGEEQSHNQFFGIKCIDISNCDFPENTKLNFKNKTIEKFNFSVTEDNTGGLQLNNARFMNLEMEGIEKEFMIELNSCQIDMLFFKRLNNPEKIFIRNVEVIEKSNNTLLKFENSQMGQTSFWSVDFSGFKNVEIENTSFEHVNLSGMTWFDDERLEMLPSDSSPVQKSKNRREFYRQIKQSLQSQGNLIESLEFKGREMKALRNELKVNDRLNWWNQDWWIMLFNKSNDFGMSWAKAFWWIIGLNTVFYLLCLPLFTSGLCYDCSWDFDIRNYANLAWKNIGVFTEIFNPVRKFSSTYGTENISGALHIFDLLHRIVLGILIFQLIRAFRKYVGK